MHSKFSKSGTDWEAGADWGTVGGVMFRLPCILRLLVAGGFTLLLGVLSTVPGTGAPDDTGFVWTVAVTPKLLQKSMHVVLYGVLTALWAWTLDGLVPRSRAIAAAAVIAFGFGAAMEVYQMNVPGRYGTLVDVLLNTAGVVAAAVVLRAWRGMRRASL